MMYRYSGYSTPLKGTDPCSQRALVFSQHS